MFVCVCLLVWTKLNKLASSLAAAVRQSRAKSAFMLVCVCVCVAAQKGVLRAEFYQLFCIYIYFNNKRWLSTKYIYAR